MSVCFLQIWENLIRQGAKTELTVACFLVSHDTSGTLLEQAKNSNDKTPLDLLLSQPKLAPFADLVKSYKDRRQPYGDQSPAPGSSGLVLYEIDTSADVDNDRSIKPLNSSRSCGNCQRIREGNEENQLGPSGSSSGYSNCTHCGCNSSKSQMYQGNKFIPCCSL